MQVCDLQEAIERLQKRGTPKYKAVRIAQGVNHFLARSGDYKNLNHQLKNLTFGLSNAEGMFTYEIDTHSGSVRIQVAENSDARKHAEYYGYYIQELVDECMEINPNIELTPAIMNDIFEVALHKWQFMTQRKFLRT